MRTYREIWECWVIRFTETWQQFSATSAAFLAAVLQGKRHSDAECEERKHTAVEPPVVEDSTHSWESYPIMLARQI